MVPFIALISSDKENESKQNTWDITKLKRFRIAKESISKTKSPTECEKAFATDV